MSYTYKKGFLIGKRGHPIGSDNGNGYLKINTGTSRKFVHVLIWEIFNGKKPIGKFIDHIDGNRKNNKIENLRLVNRSGNCHNQRVARKNNSVGVLGVCKEGKKFLASIGLDYKKIRIGLYETKEDAHEAYLSTKRQVHSTCTI